MSKKVTILFIVIALLAFVLATTASAEVGVTEGDNGLPNASHRLIVQLDSPALAEWASAEGISAAANLMVNGRLNVQADAAQAYIQQLEAEQAAFTANLATAIPGAQAATFVDATGASTTLAYQVVFNGVVVELPAVTRENIKAVANMPGVKQVFRDYEQKPAMYASLPLIGAPTMWEQLGGQDMSGEGIIVASIDTGVYAPNPFFDPTGYTYPDGYPVGDASVTTEKVIGARAYFRPWDPPLPGDDGALPGPAGSSHGTHTIGTVAGNADTEANIAGLVKTISGVAPKAQILSYKIGYPTYSIYSGSAFDAEIVMAYEDAVRDGAQVINYSFGGYDGVMPWASAVTVAREATWDAGVFVSHSAGNSGPGSASTSDASQKVMEVGASTTTGTIAAGFIDVTSPEPVPDELTGIAFGDCLFCVPLPVGEIFGPYPYTDVGTVTETGSNTLCNGETIVGDLTGQVAMISRGGCYFSDKIWNAQQAGAIAAIVYNNQGDGLINMSAGSHEDDTFTIPGAFIGQTNGEGVLQYGVDNPGAELLFDYTAREIGNIPDVMAGFSSRGPAYASFLEPDVTAPGVNILSGGYAPGGQVVLQPALDEIQYFSGHLGRVPVDLGGQQFQGTVDQPGEIQLVAAVEDDVDDAQGLAAQGVGVGGAGGQQADAETAADGVDLVGDAHQGAAVAGGQVAAGGHRQVVFVNALADFGILAGQAGVLPAHDSLEIGELVNHAAFQVRLAEVGGAADLFPFGRTQPVGQFFGQGAETGHLFV